MDTIDFFKKRRTQYALGNDLPISQNAVEQLVRTVVRETPSSFNSQSSRVVILFGEHHRRLWNITKEILRPLVPADKFASTDAKMDSFAAGAGTILFYEDRKVIEKLQADFPLYADKFPEFSANSAGMAQFSVWTALAHANIGASLQHYHPLINEQVAQQWDIPASWELSAQMPFGSHQQGFDDKTYMDDEQRFRSFY